MRSSFRLITVSSVLYIGLGAGVANANVTINVTEVGGNVVFATRGSLDLTGAALLGGIGYYSDGFIPGGSNWYVASGAGRDVDNYAMTSFAGAFGSSGTFFSSPSSVSGDDFFIWGNGGGTEQVGVPVGYISGSAISSGMVFADATIAGFTMIPGTYIYNIPNDTITLNIAAVPEPETYAMLLAGLGLLGFMARRRNESARKKRGHNTKTRG